MSLKNKTARGSAWNAGRTLLANIVDFVVYAILARELTLDEFGLVIFALLIIEFANIFTNAGINQNLIQRKSWDHSFTSSSFVFLAVLSLSISLLVAVFGSPIAYISHSKDAAVILICLSPIPFFVGLQTIFSAKLEREFNNKQLALIRSFCSIISGLLIVSLVFFDFGLWSLVIGKVFQQALVLFVLVVNSSYRPTFTLEKSDIKELFEFCLPLLWIAILDYFHNKASNLAAASILGPESFALVSVSKKSQDVLLQTTISPINKMVVPSMSRVTKENRVSAYYRMVQISSLVIIPASIGLGAVSEQFIELAFGSKFLQSAILLSITSFGVTASCMTWFLPNLLISNAATRAAFRIKLVQVIVTMITAFVFVWWGLEIMLISVVLAMYVSVPIKINIAKQYLDISLSKIILAVLPATVSSIAMFAVVKLLSDFYDFEVSLLLELATLVTVGLIVYILTFVCIFHKSFMLAVNELKSLLGKK